MDSYNFKNVLKSFKASRPTNNDSKITSYKEVIEEKLKSNKNEKSILRDFDKIEENRIEWFKERNKSLNIEKNLPDKIKQDGGNEELDRKNYDENLTDIDIITSDIPNNFEINLCKKDWTVTCDPKM